MPSDFPRFPYYDKDGSKILIDLETEEGKAEMTRLWDEKYRRVALTHNDELGTANPHAYVSTVFIPIDHSFAYYGNEPDDHIPIIFETMAFNYVVPKPWHDRLWERITGVRTEHYYEWQWRYATEEQARRGHAIVCAAIGAGKNPDVAMAAAYDC